MHSQMLIPRFTLAVLFALAAAPPATSPWEKAPEKWDEADAYRILRNSPWSPAKTKLEANYTQRHADPLTGITSTSGINSEDTGLVRGIQLSRNTDYPDVTVLWWSSKTIRLAQLRLHQLKNPAASPELLRAEAPPDHVITVNGAEQFRVLRDAKEDLHDTVFLELAGGLPLDLQSVSFVESAGGDDARVEFHFPRQVDGRPAIDPQSPRVIFHCKATAKTPHPGQINALSFHAEFHPNEMRVGGVPDL
ncbi:MAG: hypothetical protein ACRD36_00125 [Candidatus Acidiferrum sp.]